MCSLQGMVLALTDKPVAHVNAGPRLQTRGSSPAPAVLPQARTVASVMLAPSRPHSGTLASLEEHYSRDTSVPAQSTPARPTGSAASRTCGCQA